LTETAGIRIGAIVSTTFVLVLAPEPSSSPSPPLGWLARGKLTLTGLQCAPECRSVETFDHTIELPLNERLVASSNS
jgi:hypothetical protein